MTDPIKYWEFDEQIEARHRNNRGRQLAWEAIQSAAEKLGRDPVQLAERLADGKLVIVPSDVVEALQCIAQPDELLDANEGAFNVHAARRMQEQARAALAEDS